ncbi:MAG: hypothetical protein MJ082_05825 [Clostridia bacterium]|nr:hypothetical protein [Clostridia bacterium]
MTTVLCAAYDTPELLKKDAAYVCDKEDAGPVMRRAIRDAYELGVSCTFLRKAERC